MSIDATPKPFHRPWEGNTKIVLGIDIGTTQSDVAFSFLKRDASQVVHRVTRWPGQESHNQLGKIPTLVWYDTSKRAVSFGAEAQLHTIEEQAEDNGWVLAKHFKMHVHPSDMLARHDLTLDPLPPGVSLSQIYSDFLGYILKHTKSYFEDRLLDGKSIWERHSPAMEVVIAHPNGWSTREQQFLRSAAVAAGFSTPDQAPRKISFITEAEASVHFCIHHTNLGNLRPGINFAMCDIGDSIAETTLYSVISVRPTFQFQEKRATACIQAGSTLVGLEVEKFLRKSLENIGLPADRVADYTRAGVEDFGHYTARCFKDETSVYSIAFTSSRFNNPAINTRRGRMMIPGSTIKGFFDVCVKQIMESVDQQLCINGAQGSNASYIILTGNFGESPYLRQEFKKRYEPRGCQLILPNDFTFKAVADGAVIWKVTCGSSDRALQLSWGVETSVTFDCNDLDHQDRKRIMLNPGWSVIPGRWKCFATKGTTPDKNSIVRIPFSLDFLSHSAELGPFELRIYSYSGDDEPVWMKNKQGKALARFRNVATMQTNLETLREALEPILTLDGSLQWQLDFDACMRFGDTALEAYLEWQEKGVTREGPRTLISLFDDA
ncbi:unnamed protein product [Rhizoctonia solani]|uniref:Uncharacterized protein n=1 Tax=Rhizoctonia solani TaxID=456999 RepID=A0A8H2X452_9AGAM|nr:unnamed protein product [Rhizoctonia solani]